MYVLFFNTGALTSLILETRAEGSSAAEVHLSLLFCPCSARVRTEAKSKESAAVCVGQAVGNR